MHAHYVSGVCTLDKCRTLYLKCVPKAEKNKRGFSSPGNGLAANQAGLVEGE